MELGQGDPVPSRGEAAPSTSLPAISPPNNGGESGSMCPYRLLDFSDLSGSKEITGRPVKTRIIGPLLPPPEILAQLVWDGV